MANKFRAMACNVMNAASIVYHPKIRSVKAEAEKDVPDLKQRYPNLKTYTVIDPSNPFWKED